MRPLLVIPTTAATVLVATTAPAAAPASPRFSATQEPLVGNLIAPGDRVEIAYDTVGTRSPAGAVYVRNDLERRFQRLRLKLRKGTTALQTAVPRRLIRGHRLLYYAILRDRRTGLSVTVRSPAAWILSRAVVVSLGRHAFGHTRTPDAVVAHARAEQVGWQLSEPGHGPSFGPETFLVRSDGSVWLEDSLNNRLLAWQTGRPYAPASSLQLPPFSADHDVAFGPNGSVYVTGTIKTGTAHYHVLYRVAADGRVLWRVRLGGYGRDDGAFAVGVNSPLRLGPDGTVYCLVGMFNRPGGEPGWMPVATRDGRPIAIPQQRRRTLWPYQPVARGLRLVSETYTAVVDGAPHEARYALIDRRGRVVRAWRVLSRTAINFNYTTPELIGGNVVVVLDVTAGRQWEYEVLRLGARGAVARLSLPRAVFGDNLLADIRIGPDGRLYQLGSSPVSGVSIYRYSLEQS